jgi:hypothetical protein
MKSVATPRFWRLSRALPLEVQKLAEKNYRLWRNDSDHPRVWIGTHAGYDKMTGS